MEPHVFATGERDLLSDVEGITVGHATARGLRTGTTVIRLARPMAAAVDVRGGGPGTRETDALGPDGTVEHVHAIALSGGSAFGLAAASGVQARLQAEGIGFEVAGHRVPIVPAAILFDLVAAGAPPFAVDRPLPADALAPATYERLGGEALAAATAEFALGSVGAGTGATTARVRGGLGSASMRLPDGQVVAALAVTNPVGCVLVPATRHFWAAPFERGDEFGGRGAASAEACAKALADPPPLKGGAIRNTTLVVVATNVRLGRRELRRLAVMAQTGMARAIVPVHTPLDGDVVFALSGGTHEAPADLTLLGHICAIAVARAIAIGVYRADPEGAPAGHPAYRRLAEG
ncbi:MAG: peptidase T4 [Rhizobiales bacterium]|nr:peptidase T4 [Hyphomicrobiales bacterium]